MTAMLLRLFVKNFENTESPQVRRDIGTLSGKVGIFCNILLFAFKLAVGTLTGSVSITADAMNNLSDASGSVVTLIGFHMAGKPADEEHPYGHARAEYLSGLAVAALILVIGMELVKTSVDKIIHPAAVEFTAAAALVLAASVGVKLWMFLFNRGLGKRIDSTALMATAADSRNDCITTTAVLVAAIAERFLSIPMDGWMGLAVAAFILFSGFNLAKETVSPLLGQCTDPELREKIVDYVVSQPKVLGYHDLMVHDYGPGHRFASLHVEMDRREDPLVCHELIDDMEMECMRNHNVQLVIHYDPVVTDDPELRRLKEQVEGLLRQWDERLTLHDFRMVPGKSHMNLVFDVTLPFDLRSQRDQLRQWLEERMNGSGEMVYHLRITYDFPG